MAKRTAVNPTKREQREQRRKEAQQRDLVKWGILGMLGLIALIAIVFLATRPATAMGDVVPVASADHVPEGSDPGPYQSDPPAGGKHYPGTYPAGFYDEADAETLPKLHEGYLVHNLEHGHVIFWYNCAADLNLDCDELKQTIRDAMSGPNSDELVAFPWPSLEEPLVMTSWGRIMRFETLDVDQMRQFVRLNINKSPEAGAK